MQLLISSLTLLLLMKQPTLKFKLFSNFRGLFYGYAVSWCTFYGHLKWVCALPLFGRVVGTHRSALAGWFRAALLCHGWFPAQHFHPMLKDWGWSSHSLLWICLFLLFSCKSFWFREFCDSITRWVQINGYFVFLMCNPNYHYEMCLSL